MRRFLTRIAAITVLLACGTSLALTQTSPPADVRAREEAAEPLVLAAMKAAERSSATEPARVLDAIEAALKAGACPTRVLTEAAFATLHSTPRFRELIRDHARQSSTCIVVSGEAGDPMRVSGVVRDRDGKPIAGALVYVYQTDAKGYYTDGGHDSENPRIFGYLVTADDGSYAFSTIRPGHYAERDEQVDQHIHFELRAKGFASKDARLGFADDPCWKGKDVPAWAVPVQKDDAGMQSCRFDVQLKRAP